MRSTLVLFVSIVGLAGCETTAPTPLPAATPGAGVQVGGALQSSAPCAVVRFRLEASGAPPTFTGTLSGDLVGTYVSTGSGVVRTGTVLHASARESFTITGGTVPELVGRTFEATVKAIGGLPPPNGLVVSSNGQSRITAGAQSGNLSFRGVTDYGVFPRERRLDFHGVICP